MPVLLERMRYLLLQVQAEQKLRLELLQSWQELQAQLRELPLQVEPVRLQPEPVVLPELRVQALVQRRKLKILQPKKKVSLKTCFSPKENLFMQYNIEIV